MTASWVRWHSLRRPEPDRYRYYDVVPLLVASGARADWSGWGIQIEAPLARKFALIVEILTDFEGPYR